MIKKIKISFYDALFKYHMSKGISCNKIAREYTKRANRLKNKAEQCLNKMIEIDPSLEDES